MREIVGEDEVLGKVTDVVKSVMELSNKVYLSPPDEYLELVKVYTVFKPHTLAPPNNCVK